MRGLGWQHIVTEDRGITRRHVIPVGDIDDHTLSESCRCRPVEHQDEADQWSHNAWDNRESYENGRALH